MSLTKRKYEDYIIEQSELEHDEEYQERMALEAMMEDHGYPITNLKKFKGEQNATNGS